MTAISRTLSDDDINNIAEFYAQLPIPKSTQVAPDNENTRGETLYRRGDAKTHITACIACHGPAGTGNAQAGFPVLTGQQVNYTIQQLQAFKHAQRANDLNTIMRTISARMSDEDMKAIADYLGSLPK
jgi:cytochrome c553